MGSCQETNGQSISKGKEKRCIREEGVAVEVSQILEKKKKTE